MQHAYLLDERCNIHALEFKEFPACFNTGEIKQLAYHGAHIRSAREYGLGTLAHVAFREPHRQQLRVPENAMQRRPQLV